MSEAAGDIGERLRSASRQRIVASFRRIVLIPRDAALAERERWALWIPALLGSGIGFYFMLAIEPPWWSGPAFIGAAGLAVVLGRRYGGLLLPGIAALIVASGFADAQLQTWLVAAPVLDSLGGCVGAVSVSGPSYRLEPANAAEPCLATAAEISRLLGFKEAA